MCSDSAGFSNITLRLLGPTITVYTLKNSLRNLDQPALDSLNTFFFYFVYDSITYITYITLKLIIPRLFDYFIPIFLTLTVTHAFLCSRKYEMLIHIA